MSGRRLEANTLQNVLQQIADNRNNSEIFRATGCSRDCIIKIRRNLKQWGTPYPPRTQRLGRPATLRSFQRRRFQEFLRDRPGAYLEEMKIWLFDEFDISTSTGTIYRELTAMRWSRKIAIKQAREQSDALRRVFRARVAQNYTAAQIVALDESACNERTGDRKYGWSPINSSVKLSYSFKRSERWSLLPAMTVDGYLSFTIFQGAITAEILMDFLEHQVLPYCNPYPESNSVIILDNASIHRADRVRQLCEQAGVLLEYLPPYSPDYNPIEKSFKQLKSWIKKHAEMAEMFADYGVFLEYAVSRTCCNIDCRSWYRTCGFPI